MKMRHFMIIFLVGCIVIVFSITRNHQGAITPAVQNQLFQVNSDDRAREPESRSKHTRTSQTALHAHAPVELRTMEPKLVALISMFEKKSSFLENPKGFTNEMERVRQEFWPGILELKEEEVLQLIRFYETQAAGEFIGDDSAGPLLYYRLGQLGGPNAISTIEAKLDDVLESNPNELLHLCETFGLASAFTSKAPFLYSGWASVDHVAALSHWDHFLQTFIERNPRIVGDPDFNEGVARYLKRGASNKVSDCPYLNWE